MRLLQVREEEALQQREMLEKMQKSLRDWAGLLVRREEELQTLQEDIANSRKLSVSCKSKQPIRQEKSSG